MLVDLVAAITDVLRTIPGVVGVPDAPPAQLGDDRMLIVYPQPENSSPSQHGGRAGTGPVIQHGTPIVVEWHLKKQTDLIAEIVPEITAMWDAMQEALWGAFARNRFAGTAVGMNAIGTETFGELGWGSDQTFGIRLVLNVTIAAELAAGKVA